MGRSVHTTRGDLRREWRWGDGTREQRLETVKSLSQRLGLKRRIKAQVREQRRRPYAPLELPPVPAAGVPIRIVRGRHLVYPATEEDLRGVIERLPSGALNGVSEVLLSLGEDEQGESEGLDRDPLRGRVGFECLPGVWSAQVLGVYEHLPRRIQVLAYVVAEERLPQPEFSGLCLKLRALSTFVHEVAHHQDRSLRVARGRWRMDDPARNERYAEDRQHRWVLDAVIPYLEDAYPDECEALERWLLRHTGLELSLWDLAGDPRTTRPDGSCGARFDLRDALPELVRNLEAGESRREAQLSFANDLHYADLFPQALEVITLVRAESPEDLRARVLEADVLEHLERREEAEALLLGVLEEAPRRLDALRVLRLIHHARRDWRRLALVVDVELSLAKEDWRREGATLLRARAALELAQYQLLDELTPKLRDSLTTSYRIAAEVVHLLGLLRRGRLAELGQRLAEVNGDHDLQALTSRKDELELIRYAHLRHLGRPAWRPGKWALERLRQRGYGPWLAELVPQLRL